MWHDNKRAGMPFSKLVNAAHHSLPSSPSSLSQMFCSLCFFSISLSVSLPPLGTAVWSRLWKCSLYPELCNLVYSNLDIINMLTADILAFVLSLREVPVATKSAFLEQKRALKLTPPLCTHTSRLRLSLGRELTIRSAQIHTC